MKDSDAKEKGMDIDRNMLPMASVTAAAATVDGDS